MHKRENIDFLNKCFLGILLCKIVLLIFFSSSYQNQLFVPFVKHFLSNFDNPWQYVYSNPQEGIEFPYSPIMLYILSIFYAPVHFLNINIQVVTNLFIKMPTLLADLFIYKLLLNSIGNKKKVLLYYFS